LSLHVFPFFSFFLPFPLSLPSHSLARDQIKVGEVWNHEPKDRPFSPFFFFPLSPPFPPPPHSAYRYSWVRCGSSQSRLLEVFVWSFPSPLFSFPPFRPPLSTEPDCSTTHSPTHESRSSIRGQPFPSSLSFFFFSSPFSLLSLRSFLPCGRTLN